MEFFNSVFYFILVIGILILIHELGHFIAARLTGMRTEVFSIGMGYRLLGFNKKYGFTFGKLPKQTNQSEDSSGDSNEDDWYCDYRLAILPIGGYVKIAGMVDESLDTKFTKSEAKPWEFRSKSTLQKAFVLSGGVVMNFLLAVIIFSILSFSKGEIMTEVNEVGYVRPNSLASESGFRIGDKIIAVNGHEVKYWQEIRDKITIENFGETKNVAILRNNQELNLVVDGKAILDTMKNVDTFEAGFGIYPTNLKVYVSEVMTTWPAGKAGIKAGDTIIAVNKTPINNITQFISLIERNADRKIFIEWKSGDKILGDSIKPNEEKKIGAKITDVYVGNIIVRQYNIFEAFVVGFNQSVGALNLLINSISKMIEGKVSVKQSIGGPIFIAKNASQQAELGIANFLTFTALLSISLAVINILPFPALDGGHLLMTLIEGIIRREIPLKVKLAFQQIGVFLLIALIIFIIYIDLTR